MKTVKKILYAVENAKTAVICHHVAPDGDCLGSALALRKALGQFKNLKRVDAVLSGQVPDIYKFLPGIDTLINIKESSLHETYDIAFAVDCAGRDRLGEAERLFNNAKKTVNIDHHISNNGFADIDLIVPSASATGEVLYSLIKDFGVELTEDMAINLYTAILTDTGGFKFENTKAETFSICSKLLGAGADPVNIYKECYELKPAEMVKLHARAVNEAVFLEENQIVFSKITRRMLEETNSSDEHIDGITEILRQINTVKIALVFKETLKGSTKISMRSNGPDVCEIASFFGGGGHKLASGCLVEKNVDEAVNDVIATVINRLKVMSEV